MKCYFKYLYVFVFVEDMEMKIDLFKNKYISEVLEEGKMVDMVIVGVLSFYNYSIMEEIGYINFEDIEELCYKDVVGDINLCFFIVDGKEVKIEINIYVIGFSLEELKNIFIVVVFVNGL